MYRLLCFLLALPAVASAQTPPTESLAIQQVYAQFSRGYAAFNADTTAACYHPEGAMVFLGAGDAPRWVEGLPALNSFFGDFFKSLQKENASIRIDFQIVRRQLAQNRAYDSGIYRLAVRWPSGATRTSYGWLAISLQKHNGRWLFMNDANTPATQADWEALQTPKK